MALSLVAPWTFPNPAEASHGVGVETSVELIDVGGTPTARLFIDSEWTSSDSGYRGLVALYAPDGTVAVANNLATKSVDASRTGAGNTGNFVYNEVVDFPLTGLTQAGLYRIVQSNSYCGCGVDSFNVSGSRGTSVEASFYFDPGAPTAWSGSPAFNAALITRVPAGPDTGSTQRFEQDLGGVGPNGGTLRYSFIEDSRRLTAALQRRDGAPVSRVGLEADLAASGTKYGKDWRTGGFDPERLVTIDDSTGVLSIEREVVRHIASQSTHALRRVTMKILLEEVKTIGGVETVVGAVTRDLALNFLETTNVAPSIVVSVGGSPLASGATVPVEPGGTVDVVVTGTDTDSAQSVALAFLGLPAFGTSISPVGGDPSPANPRVRTLRFEPPSDAPDSSRTIVITATDSDTSFPLTSQFLLNLTVSGNVAPPVTPPATPPLPSPIAEPGGGVPSTPPGSATGSVGGVPTTPTPARPTTGSAEFRVGNVETRVDVASSGAGRVGGTGSAPVIEAVRDRVATVSGGGMRPGGIAEVWLPLPNGGSRQVALLPIGPDGRFDGALPFTGELDGRGPLPIGERTIQLFGVDANGQLTVINFGVRIEQPGPLAPEPDRGRGAVPTLALGQSLATNAGVPTPVTVTPIPDARTTRIEGDGWLMDVDVPDGEVRDEGGAPLIEIVNGTDSVVRGTGFMPGTRAYVWLMSDPTFLGEVTVRADGSFSGSVAIDGVPAGEHTLQLSGVGTDGFVRAANLGVVLVGDGMPRPTRVPAGDGPLQVPGGALLWVLGLAGTAAFAHRRLIVEGR